MKDLEFWVLGLGLGSKAIFNYNETTITQRVRVPNIWVPGIWVIVIIIEVLGKYMIIGYLDP